MKQIILEILYVECYDKGKACLPFLMEEEQMLTKIREYNPGLVIHEVTDAEFHKYGNVLKEFDFSPCIEIMSRRAIPVEGNVYVGDDPEMGQTSIAESLKKVFYGDMPVQVGYCNGNSTKLNALEYHKGTEIDVAVTDLVLLLGDVRDIKDNTYDSHQVEAFYLNAGTAVELYGTTLHFAPCKVTAEGFKSIIVLPLHTNEALPEGIQKGEGESMLLWMRNKWLIAHKESIPASRGACAGIYNENIEVRYAQQEDYGG